MHRLVCIQRFGLYAVNSMNKREYLDDTIARSLSPYHLDDIQVPSVGWDVTSDGTELSRKRIVVASKRCKEIRSSGEPAFQKVEIKCIERDVGKLLPRIEFLALPLSTQFIARLCQLKNPYEI